MKDGIIKVIYTTPEMEIVEFEKEDIITTSSGTGYDPDEGSPFG